MRGGRKGEQMIIKKLGRIQQAEVCVNRIEFIQDDVRYTITPELPHGFRIHRNDGEQIALSPCVRNEVIIR